MVWVSAEEYSCFESLNCGRSIFGQGDATAWKAVDNDATIESIDVPT